MANLILLREWQASQIEFWRPISGFTDYDVSSWGRVRSRWGQHSVKKPTHGTKRCTFRPPRILKSAVGTGGYLLHGIGGRTRLAQRLVAEAFIPNPDNLRTVNHRTGLKSDNRVDNLEWATHKENITHAISTGLRQQLGEHNCRALVTETDVRNIRRRYANGERQTRLAEEFGVKPVTIHAIIARRNWKHVD